MKNQTLNEELARIKGMMKINEDIESSIDGKEQKLTSVEEVIDYIKMVSSQVEQITETMSNKLLDTEFWNYVKPMYSGLRSVSDMEGFHTRSDEKSRNISTVLDIIKNDYDLYDSSSVESDDYDVEDDEPSDDDIMNGFGREGGVSYNTDSNWQGR
jgi:hypothetical protein